MATLLETLRPLAQLTTDCDEDNTSASSGCSEYFAIGRPVRDLIMNTVPVAWGVPRPLKKDFATRGSLEALDG